MTKKFNGDRGKNKHMITKVFYTDKDIDGMVHDIIRQTVNQNWRPDYIIGITRGGLIPAVYLSQYLNIKMETLKVSLSTTDCESNCWMAEDALEGKNILIVDDIVDQGNTFDWIKNDWKTIHHPNDPRWDSVWNNNVKFASLIYNEACNFNIDYTSETINKSECPQWAVFPWEQWWKDYSADSGL
jgi:hypoxanthine phosphoribosyltransferase